MLRGADAARPERKSTTRDHYVDRRVHHAVRNVSKWERELLTSRNHYENYEYNQTHFCCTAAQLWPLIPIAHIVAQAAMGKQLGSRNNGKWK